MSSTIISTWSKTSWIPKIQGNPQTFPCLWTNSGINRDRDKWRSWHFLHLSNQSSYNLHILSIDLSWVLKWPTFWIYLYVQNHPQIHSIYLRGDVFPNLHPISQPILLRTLWLDYNQTQKADSSQGSDTQFDLKSSFLFRLLNNEHMLSKYQDE